MYLTTRYPTYLYCFESSAARVLCPLAERPIHSFFDIVTPFGFSGFVGTGNDPDFPFHWREFATNKGYVCSYVALNPLLENSALFDPADVFQSNSLYYLDLTLSIDELVANLDRNRKRQLKDWEERNRNFVLDKDKLKRFFLTHYHCFLERVGATPASHFSRETLMFLCDLDNVHMVGAGAADKIEAVYVFAATPHVADCMFNIPLAQGRRHATSLLWYGVNHFKLLNVPLLNLGGGICEDDSVAQSKQRFGARRVPFHCLKQVYDSLTFRRLCQETGTNHEDMKGYFPPYRKPQPHV
jgi:hypothetical protein